jgi:diaminopropionate ammonia-lyase
VGLPDDPPASLSELSKRLAPHRPVTLVAATDGNHGRAVARMAALMDVGAHILVPADMSAARIKAIEDEGAEVTVVDGTYDEAVARSAAEADDRHLVISDTSWPGYEQVPAWVIEGYSTIGWEIEDRRSELDLPMPTVLAVQIGVGALAAALARQFGSLAHMIGVEPIDAACAFAAVEAGAIVDVPGPHRSIMAGLNCGRVSLIAWPVISSGLETFLAIRDADAREAMRLLADAGIESGESGAAGLAGLLAFRDDLRLDSEASALIISTEGATDPDTYARIVGRNATQLPRPEGH